jgi:hypothetical protein
MRRDAREKPRHREFERFVMGWGVGRLKGNEESYLEAFQPPAFRAGPFNSRYQRTSFEKPFADALDGSRPSPDAVIMLV